MKVSKKLKPVLDLLYFVPYLVLVTGAILLPFEECSAKCSLTYLIFGISIGFVLRGSFQKKD